MLSHTIIYNDDGSVDFDEKDIDVDDLTCNFASSDLMVATCTAKDGETIYVTKIVDTYVDPKTGEEKVEEQISWYFRTALYSTSECNAEEI